MHCAFQPSFRSIHIITKFIQQSILKEEDHQYINHKYIGCTYMT